VGRAASGRSPRGARLHYSHVEPPQRVQPRRAYYMGGAQPRQYELSLGHRRRCMNEDRNANSSHVFSSLIVGASVLLSAIVSIASSTQNLWAFAGVASMIIGILTWVHYWRRVNRANARPSARQRTRRASSSTPSRSSSTRSRSSSTRSRSRSASTGRYQSSSSTRSTRRSLRH